MLYDGEERDSEKEAEDTREISLHLHAGQGAVVNPLILVVFSYSSQFQEKDSAFSTGHVFQSWYNSFIQFLEVFGLHKGKVIIISLTK